MSPLRLCEDLVHYRRHPWDYHFVEDGCYSVEVQIYFRDGF